MEKQTLSLYVHIPFCQRKCAYCDFVSYPLGTYKLDEYIHAVCSEIRSQAAVFSDKNVATLYIGGGTPSLLQEEHMRQLFGALKECFSYVPSPEITMEANPGSFTESKLETWLKLGVNRISIGVQSFDDALLNTIGRVHTAKQGIEAVESAHKMGLRNISLDLMYGLPGQTGEQWRRTLEQACALETQHISCYSLIVEDNTALKYRLMNHPQLLLAQDEQEERTLEMENCTKHVLTSNGFERYEVSNYSKPAYESRHNLAYWECDPYLGFGCSAHSMIPQGRFYNTSSLRLYMSGAPEGRRIQEGQNTKEERVFERVMMGLRMVKGIDLKRFRADFGCDPWVIWPETIRTGIQDGFLCVQSDRLKLTENGMEVMNQLLVKMLEENE